MTRASLDEVYVRSERMVGRRIGEGYVLVPIARRGADLDGIFALNDTAACVWERIDGSRDGHGIVALLVEEFDVDAAQATADYMALLERLLSIDALRPVRASSQDAP